MNILLAFRISCTYFNTAPYFRKRSNISANYLSAVFSQEMGATFTEYVTGNRMELAKELLRTTDKRSGEVAAAVGYRDPHYFSFLFKKTQGCTPRDYRGGGKRP